MKFHAVLCSIAFGCSLLAADPRTNKPATLPGKPETDRVLGSNTNLTEQQRTKLRESNERFRTEQTALYKRLQTVRRELEQSAQANPASEKTIREKASELGQIEGDLAVLRSRHYRELGGIIPRGTVDSVTIGTNAYSSHLGNTVRVPTSSLPGGTNSSR